MSYNGQGIVIMFNYLCSKCGYQQSASHLIWSHRENCGATSTEVKPVLKKDIDKKAN